MDTPILTPAAVEGTTTLFETEYFDEGKAYLAQSGQLYNEANILAFGKVYCFGPTFRAEKSKTRRHLTEFWMVEPEIAFCDLDGLMEVEEQFVTHIVKRVLRDRAPELKSLGRDLSKLEKIAAPFPRISYDEAAKMIQEIYEKETDPEKKELLKFEWGMDFGAPHETELTNRCTKSRSLSMATRPRSKPFTWNPGRVAPKSASPWICSRRKAMARSSAARNACPAMTCCWQRIHEHDLPEEAFRWYLDLRKYRLRPPQRLRHGRGTHGLMDLRHRTHPRGDCLPAHDQAGVSVRKPTANS